jgi:tetraacyldisaccharide 4'-kinase
MNLNNPILKIIRWILFPIALLYGLILYLRYWLYKKNILHSVPINIPNIAVGNLSVGGTGKTPMVLYLLNLLHKNYNIATISRGYKRATKGFVLANANSTAKQIGDEPYLFKQQFPLINVVACEDRLIAVPQLLQEAPETNLILFDDVLQHRKINPAFSICLTEYQNIYTNDYYLPTGQLRDHKANAERFNIIVVTKCPLHLNEAAALNIKTKLNLSATQSIFFTGIQYGHPFVLLNRNAHSYIPNHSYQVITGIANAAPMIHYLKSIGLFINHYEFPDHYNYSLPGIHNIFKNNNYIITTEKDAVKLKEILPAALQEKVVVLPISIQFLQHGEKEFNEKIITYLAKNK